MRWKTLKSSKEHLRKRGYVTDKEIKVLAAISRELLLNMLHSNDAVTRTKAACNLVATDKNTACELIMQLSVEKCLYTKIAICESLEKGDCATAIQMTEYLGKIGNNQHKTLPNKVSGKKSFPLPRDIVARALGKMGAEVFPVLQTVVKGNDIEKIQEVLDAIGFMVFYNENLATSENVMPILSLVENYTDNHMILWKVVLCLSAFPLTESKKVLLKYADKKDVIGVEAQRSLRLLEQRKGLQEEWKENDD